MIELKPLTEEHITPFYTWINDEAVIKFSLTLFQDISTEEEISKWYSGLLKDSKNYTTGIFLKESEVFIGYAGICNISNTNRSGEYFVFIGDKSQWGRGIGTLTTQKVLEYGFEKLKLNRIMLTVSEPNISGIRAYEKAGLQLEGRLRQASFRDGKYHDKLVMSILREDWI
jgi:RimJ/RimL family protein N-acetyltransferase